jgi:lipopolysaccharide O-acetyltransferase
MQMFREKYDSIFNLKTTLEKALTRVHNQFLARIFRVRRIYIRSGSYLRGLSHIHLGENFDAGYGLWMEAITKYGDQSFSPHLEIGNDVSISFWGHISAAQSISIGSGVMIGSKVTIIDHDHGSYGGQNHTSPLIPPAQRPLKTSAIQIGPNCWLGDGVVVTAGAEIGEGTIIGANAVVKGKIPAFTIAVGIPAKPVKRFDFEQQQWVDIATS